MSPRPKKVTDDEIFAAAQRVMSRVAPGDLSLARIAAEAGVTAGALVQRFGSKRELMLALSERWAGSAGELFASLRAQYASPVQAIFAYGECMAGLAPSPAAYARNVAYLLIDLTDADLRKHVVRNARATRKHLAALIQEAIDAGELPDERDADRLARTVETVVNGSLMTWAFYRKGSAGKWLAEDLRAVLGDG